VRSVSAGFYLLYFESTELGVRVSMVEYSFVERIFVAGPGGERIFTRSHLGVLS